MARTTPVYAHVAECPTCHHSFSSTDKEKLALEYDVNVKKTIDSHYVIQYHSLSYPFCTGDDDLLHIVTYNAKTKEAHKKVVGFMLDAIIQPLDDAQPNQVMCIPICEQAPCDYKEKHISGIEMVGYTGALFRQAEDQKDQTAESRRHYGEFPRLHVGMEKYSEGFRVHTTSSTLIYDVDLLRIPSIVGVRTNASVLVHYNWKQDCYVANIIRLFDQDANGVVNILKKYRHIE